MPKIDYYIDTYHYFNLLNQSPINESVLDFGSNYGLFLDSSKGKFPQNLYTGIDVDIDAINIGKQMYPNANFIHYDRFNLMYNHEGQLTWPNLEEKFNYIISYSVMTHTSKEDFVETVDWLYPKLKKNGKMFITFLDVENRLALDFFYKKRIRDFGSCDKVDKDGYTYLIDNLASKEAKKAKFFLSFYQKSYLKELLSSYDCTFTGSPDISRGCIQDCIILRA